MGWCAFSLVLRCVPAAGWVQHQDTDPRDRVLEGGDQRASRRGRVRRRVWACDSQLCSFASYELVSHPWGWGEIHGPKLSACAMS